VAARLGRLGGTPEQPALFFTGPEEFARWLEVNHDSAVELWMGLDNKHVSDRGLTWKDAVVEALRWGWIDSRAERIDEDSRRQRWTPRRPGSNWSAVNIATAERLIAEGRMTPAGMAAFERRRPDRSGIYAYEQPHAELSPEFAALLARDEPASAFWHVASPSYRKLAINWVMTAKQQATREKRMSQLIDDCANGRLIPSQRYGSPPTWVARAADAAQDARAE
jgi:uncharacterized protein YdeI (YjbR/CyaY-like superfamily)